MKKIVLNWRSDMTVKEKRAGLLFLLAFGLHASLLILPEQTQASNLPPPLTLKTAQNDTDLYTAQVNGLFLCAGILGQIVPLNLRLSTNSALWMNGNTLNIPAYNSVSVSGSRLNVTPVFNTVLTETERQFKGNGIPNHRTGVFPVQPGTAAYTYYSQAPAMGYSSAAAIPIEPYDFQVTVPRNPVYLEIPQCMDSLVFGVATQTGSRWDINVAYVKGPNGEVVLVDPVSALPLDQCWGHPYSTQYHYHGYSWKCFPNQGSAREHSPLYGYALDGFGIYGPHGDNGKLLTNNDLDECHGHFGNINWDGVNKYMYHYHLNTEFPYGPGCFRGVPATITAFTPAVHDHSGGTLPPHM